MERWSNEEQTTEDIQEMDRIFPKENIRKTRGLLNVIGTMVKALFGLMDNQNFQFINVKIDDLQKVASVW